MPPISFTLPLFVRQGKIVGLGWRIQFQTLKGRNPPASRNGGEEEEEDEEEEESCRRKT